MIVSFKLLFTMSRAREVFKGHITQIRHWSTSCLEDDPSDLRVATNLQGLNPIAPSWSTQLLPPPQRSCSDKKLLFRMRTDNLVMDSCDYQTDDTESEDDYLDDEGGQVKLLTFPWNSIFLSLSMLLLAFGF